MSVPRPDASSPRTPPGRSVAAIARRAPGLSVNQWNAMLLTTASNPPSGHRHAHDVRAVGPDPDPRHGAERRLVPREHLLAHVDPDQLPGPEPGHARQRREPRAAAHVEHPRVVALGQGGDEALGARSGCGP